MTAIQQYLFKEVFYFYAPGINDMQTKTFSFSFSELGILPSDIEFLLGFTPGNSPYPFPEIIKNELAAAGDIIKISTGYVKYSDISIDKNKGSVRIQDQLFYPGKYAVEQFKNALSAAIFVCTAGTEVSDLTAVKESGGDHIESFITDMIGSIAVEKGAEKLRIKLEEDARKVGLNITSSFSPGYCDWDVAEQQKLFKLLPDKFCGIKLSSSSLMYPVKSVSGIICTGPDFFRSEIPCYRCDNQECIYGKLRRLKKL